MSRRGVTLLEILIAIVIFAAGIFTVLTLFPNIALTAKKSQFELVAAQLAQRKVEEIRSIFQSNAPSTLIGCDPQPPGCLATPPCYDNLICIQGIPTPIAFPPPFNNYYFSVDRARIVPPVTGTKLIDGPGGAQVTGEWDVTNLNPGPFRRPPMAYMIQVTVRGPADTAANLTTQSASVSIVTIISRYANVTAINPNASALYPDITLTGWKDPSAGCPGSGGAPPNANHVTEAGD